MKKRIDRKWHHRLLAVAVCLCLLLSACTNKSGESAWTNPISQILNPQETPAAESQTALARSEVEYSVQTYSYQGSEADFFHVRYYGGCAFLRKYDNDSNAWEVDRISSKTGEMETFISLKDLRTDKEWLSAVCFDVTAEGGVKVLAVVYEPAKTGEENDEPKEFRFLDYDKEGKLTGSTVIEEDLGLSDVWRAQTYMGVDGNGNTFLWRDGEYYFAADGTLLSKTPLEKNAQKGLNSLARSKASGDLILCTYDAESGIHLKIADFKKGKLKDCVISKEHISDVGDVTEGPVGECTEADLLLKTSDKLFLYNEKTKETKELLDFSSCGVQGYEIRMTSLTGDKVLGVSSTQKTLYVFSPEGGGDRKVVVLSTIQKTALSQMIASYNSSQTKYLVKVVEYGRDATSSLEWQDPANRMMMDILGDSPPDLIDMKAFLLVSLNPSIEDFVEKGYVEDLWSYIDRSETLSRDDFEAKAMALCEHKGVLAAIPTAYAIDTMSVSSEELGKRSGWSVDDLIAYDKAHPEESLIDDCKAQSVFTLVINRNLDAFVDFDAKKADFDTPEFRKMIEYAKTYPAGETIIYYNAEERLVRLESIEGVLQVQRSLNIHFDGKAQFIGYPSLDGTPQSFLRLASDGVALAICKNGTEKEGAWDFIEYVQNMELDDSRKSVSGQPRYTNTYDGIPVRKAVLDKVLEYLAEEKEYYFTEHFPDGTSFTNHPLGDAEKAVFEELLSNTRVTDRRIDTIRRIVYEELGEYFAGQQSTDAVINVINQRVNLYLLEN